MSALDKSLARAQAAWGEPLPDWIACLARQSAETSQREAAARIGRSASLVSQVLGGVYRGDLGAIEDAVRGAWMNASVDCPALGTLPTHECQAWRRKARSFVNVNSLRVRMYRACSNCPRNRKDDHE